MLDTLNGYFVPDAFMGKKTTKNRAVKMMMAAENLRDIEKMDHLDLLCALTDLEKMCLTIRQEIANRNEGPGGIEDLFRNNSLPYGKVTTYSPVTLEVSENLLRFSLPNTVVTSSADSWYLAKMAGVEIEKYESEHGKIAVHVPKPVYIVVKRKDTEKKNYRDNENFEVSKLINEICRHLGYTDSIMNVDYVSLFRQIENPEESGTEIIIFSRSKMPDFYCELM